MSRNYKVIFIVLIILMILYLWAELGVGIFFQDSWGGYLLKTLIYLLKKTN